MSTGSNFTNDSFATKCNQTYYFKKDSIYEKDSGDGKKKYGTLQLYRHTMKSPTTIVGVSDPSKVGQSHKSDFKMHQYQIKKVEDIENKNIFFLHPAYPQYNAYNKE